MQKKNKESEKIKGSQNKRKRIQQVKQSKQYWLIYSYQSRRRRKRKRRRRRKKKKQEARSKKQEDEEEEDEEAEEVIRDIPITYNFPAPLHEVHRWEYRHCEDNIKSLTLSAVSSL